MATVINNPSTPAVERDSSSGFLVGVVVLIIAAVLFFMYGLPALSGAMRGPQVNVPGKVDVNVHTPGK